MLKRKPTKKAASTSSAKTVAPLQLFPEKRKRGRPRKHPLPFQQETPGLASPMEPEIPVSRLPLQSPEVFSIASPAPSSGEPVIAPAQQPEIARNFEQAAAAIPVDIAAPEPVPFSAAEPESGAIELRRKTVFEQCISHLENLIDVPFNFLARRFGVHWQLTPQEKADSIEALKPVLLLHIDVIIRWIEVIGNPEYVFAGIYFSSLIGKKWLLNKRAPQPAAEPEQIPSGSRTVAFSANPVAENHGFSDELSKPRLDPSPSIPSGSMEAVRA